MDFAPSYPPSPLSTYCDDSRDHTRSVEALVVLAVLSMFLLHVLGSLRRLSSNRLLHSIVMGVYTLSYPLVSYIIGRMQCSDWYYDDFAVWAVFLLLLLGGTDNLTACQLNEIDNWKSIYVKHFFKGFLLVYIVVKFSRGMSYLAPLSATLLVVVLKWYVRIASMRMVSKSYLSKKVKVITDYMQHVDNLVVPFDPVTMEGYQYMVAGEKHCINRPGRTPWYKNEDLNVTTVEQIWRCKGNLLMGGQGKALKDVCLSMALSKMLNRRFAGFNLSEAELDKTHIFVFKGLLAGGDNSYKRAFKVIEDELVFVHDLYYTRYCYLYHKGRYLAVFLPVIMFALCSWLTCLLIEPLKDQYMGRPTIFITVTMAFLEAYQLYMYMASGWFKVALIRSYVTTPFLQRSGCFLEIIIGHLLTLKAFRPWKNRLGQYCLLQELGQKSKVRNCLHYATLGLVDKAMKGRKNSVKLPKIVKKAIVNFLQESNGHLTNGVTSLQKNGVHGDLSWACHATATDGAVTRTILVWHIATTLCEHQLDKHQSKKENNIEIASTLSKYCMHLLAFAPNLLPDHRSISESILDHAIEDAGKLLKEAKDKKIEGKDKKIVARCQILLEISTDDCVGDETKLTAQGVQLARYLTENIQDFTTRWTVLSEFWAEMMLYVSPSDDARAHLEVLAKGGEFITHLWALLTHAGVLKRGPTQTNDVV
ncbi:unnamed protein product [Urochloa humidicola]